MTREGLLAEIAVLALDVHKGVSRKYIAHELRRIAQHVSDTMDHEIEAIEEMHSNADWNPDPNPGERGFGEALSGLIPQAKGIRDLPVRTLDSPLD